MAKYNVKHSCGCTVEHNLFGKSDYREYKIGKLEEEKCYNCQQNEIIEEKLKSGKYEIIEVHYSVFAKDRDTGVKSMISVPDSYDKTTKTIKVIVKKSIEEAKEVEEVKTEEKIIQEIDKKLEKRLDNGVATLSEIEAKEIVEPVETYIKKHNLNKKKVYQLLTELLNGKYNKKVSKDNGYTVIILSV